MAARGGWAVSFGWNAPMRSVDHGPEHCAVLRRHALNLLKRQTPHGHGTQAQRVKAAWDAHYLLKMLEAACPKCGCPGGSGVTTGTAPVI